MPTVTEVLMAPGSFSVPFRRAPELEELLEYYEHVQFWWGSTLIAQGPYLRQRPQRGLLMVEGGLMPWWLGVDNEGPLIELARYRSGTNKVPNGDFSDGDLYWRTAEDSSWVIPSPSGIGGGSGIRTSGDYGRDDVLESAEDFEVFPGDSLHASMLAQHFTSDTGRVHLRLTYDGLFNQPNLAPPLQGGGYWASPESTAVVSGVSSGGRSNPAAIKMGPTPKAQFIDNGGFESGSGTSVPSWTFGANTTRDTGTTYKGAASLRIDGGGAASQVFATETLAPDDELTFSCWAAPTVPVNFNVLVQFKYYDTDGNIQTGAIARIETPNETGFKHYQFDYTVPSDFDRLVNTASLLLTADDVYSAGEGWNIDEVTLTRVRGNIAEIKTFDVETFNPANRTDYLSVIPEEEYEFTVWVRSDAGVNHGNIWCRIVTRFDDSDGAQGEERIEGEVRSITNNQWHRIGVRFTPSSGFAFALLDIVVQDVYGGSFYVDDPICRIVDKHKRIANVGITPGLAPGPSPYTVHFDSTVPSGAQTARVSVIAERDGNGWQVDNVSVKLNGTPDNAEDIVADLVAMTGLSSGDIHPAGPIAFDWVVRNEIMRPALDELSGQGVVNPPREWRVNADGSVDWGQASDIFADRTNIVFVEGESWLIDDPDAERSNERFPSRVKLVGAERRRRNGLPFLITATADNDVGSFKRFDGSSFVRVRLEENGNVDTQPFAAALSRDTADRLAVEQESYTIGVADWRTLGKFDVGDWTYLFHPSEGIKDPARPVMWEGRTVYPRRLRAISRDWTLGSGPFRVLLRRNAGDVIDVSEFVEWPQETKATVELGDRRPDFILNPQGGPASRQYMKFRTSVRDG